MAYTIKYHGYEVACDTVADLQALVDLNGDKPPKASVQVGITQTGRDEALTGMAGMIAKLRKEQRELLRSIAANGIVQRDRLVQLAGTSDPHQFAGLLIGISKTAAGAGMESPIEKLTARINGRGPRVYQYKIKDDVKADVKEALSKL